MSNSNDLIKISYKDTTQSGNHYSHYSTYYTIKNKNTFRTPFVQGLDMTDGHTQIVLCWPESRLWAIYNEKGFLHKIHAAGPEASYAQFVLDKDENVIKATFRGTGVNMATITYNKEGYATDVSFSHKAFGNWHKGQPALKVNEIFTRCDTYSDEIEKNVEMMI